MRNSVSYPNISHSYSYQEFPNWKKTATMSIVSFSRIETLQVYYLDPFQLLSFRQHHKDLIFNASSCKVTRR